MRSILVFRIQNKRSRGVQRLRKEINAGRISIFASHLNYILQTRDLRIYPVSRSSQLLTRCHQSISVIAQNYVKLMSVDICSAQGISVQTEINRKSLLKRKALVFLKTITGLPAFLVNLWVMFQSVIWSALYYKINKCNKTFRQIKYLNCAVSNTVFINL